MKPLVMVKGKPKNSQMIYGEEKLVKWRSTMKSNYMKHNFLIWGKKKDEDNQRRGHNLNECQDNINEQNNIG